MTVLRSIRNGLATLAVFLFLWVLFPPRLLFNPTDVSISGTQVTVYREFPLAKYIGSPLIEYHEVVRGNLADGNALTCSDDSVPFRYSSTNPTLGTWDIEAWAEACMVDGYRWEATWIVYLFDLIPLRPISLSYVHHPNVN